MAVREFMMLLHSQGFSSAPNIATGRGLAFVSLYATYEYTVRSSTQTTLASLRKDPLAIGQLRKELLALVLSPLWDSASSSGPPKIWDARISILNHADKKVSVSSIQDTHFPVDGSHFRPRQLHTLWKVFGISDPIVPELRFLGRIEELVENRNAISHGRRTAADVGRSYSKSDIETRIDDVEAICNYLVETMKTHYESGLLVA